MKAAQYNANKEAINLVSVPKPSVQVGHALVKINVASINPVDGMVHQGYLTSVWAMPLPFIPGYDVSGVIESFGNNETTTTEGFAVGDEVFAVNWGAGSHGTVDHPIGGAFAEYISIPVTKLSHKPSTVSHDTAAAIALVGTTALEALNVAKVGAGSKVLILGASSSVGLLAVQLAKLKGAWVATTASSRSLDFAKQFGPDLLINYTESKWWLEADTGVSGYDFVFDTVGETEGFAHAQTAGVVKEGGVFISIASHDVGFNPVAHQPHFSFASFFCLTNDAAIQDELITLVSEGKLVLPIDEVYPFTQQGLNDIFEKVKGGKSLGKNLLRIAN